ncbi:DUF2934 domain-containing protein [Rhizobium tubonense]|uniref:DUF2934 domain-containing protein n=1 Tax=Rhizobium tubonense TaxID=484088 RepID=A0A2W4C3X8_9HYPH|nr:DUF2934 domain-containing protein [Rhizobium tubonense]PZM08207.1 hypothetical protein CPY51_29680 [Rhizobium tubonense]
MNHTKDDWISQRAYSLWEAEGRPEGRGGGHWAQAAIEFERLEQTRASVDGSELVAKLRAASRLMQAASGDASLPGASSAKETASRKSRTGR